MTDFGRPTNTSDLILRANKTLGLRSFEMRQAQTPNEAQFRKVLHYCRSRRHPVRDTTIFMVSLYAGLRAKEIAALKLEDVFDDTGAV